MKAKRTRKISKKAAGACPQCRAALKAADRSCPACGQQAPLYAGKGVRLVLITKGGRVRKPVAWGCPCRRLNAASAAKCAGCKSPRGSGWDCVPCGRVNYGKAGFCSDCGSRKGTTAGQHLAKTARAMPPLEFIAKAAGFASAAQASVYDPDPDRRVMFGKALYSPDGAA